MQAVKIPVDEKEDLMAVGQYFQPPVLAMEQEPVQNVLDKEEHVDAGDD